MTSQEHLPDGHYEQHAFQAYSFGNLNFQPWMNLSCHYRGTKCSTYIAFLASSYLSHTYFVFHICWNLLCVSFSASTGASFVLKLRESCNGVAWWEHCTVHCNIVLFLEDFFSLDVFSTYSSSTLKLLLLFTLEASRRLMCYFLICYCIQEYCPCTVYIVVFRIEHCWMVLDRSCFLCIEWNSMSSVFV